VVPPPARGALTTAMTTLAGTPDHASSLNRQMVTIARLTADRVAAADYASITALQGKAYITVAVSDDLIRAVDESQYADDAGPCLDALQSGAPVGVPDIDLTVQWPGFHEAAPGMGLQASVSVPLHAGRGDAIAVLNVYGHDRAAMAPLIAGICAVHGLSAEQDVNDALMAGLDPGGRELVTGYAESLSIRAGIRLAIEIIKTSSRCSTQDAYLSLCVRAGEAGTDLAAAATTLINQDL
jgi:hypothetical protein